MRTSLSCLSRCVALTGVATDERRSTATTMMRGARSGEIGARQDGTDPSSRLVGGGEVVDVVIRELRRFDDADVDRILAERVVDVAGVFRPETRLPVIGKHECGGRRPT